MRQHIARSNKDVRRLIENWERDKGSKPQVLWSGTFFLEQSIVEPVVKVHLDLAEAELFLDYELLVCIKFKDWILVASSPEVFVRLQEKT